MKENESITQSAPAEKKGGTVFKKVLNAIINILIVVVLIVSLLIAVMALTSKANGISTIFGYTIQPIQSDSMKGESPDGYPGGNFGKGDLMIAKATNRDSSMTFEVGDIVTYSGLDTDGNEYLMAHRIINVAKASDGTLTYQTQGDNREMSEVPDQMDEASYLSAGSIVSVYYTKDFKGMMIKGLGAPLDFIRTQQGFFFVVLLPMILFFLYELIRVVLNFSNYKKAKADEDKEAAVKEAVAAAKAESKLDLPDSLAEMTPEQLEQFKQFMAMQQAQNEPADQPEQPDTEEPAEQEAAPEE